MKASDIMSKQVVTVGTEATVAEVAKLMIERGVSGMPVVDRDNRVVGMISEGDLIRRSEIDTDERPSGWLSFFTTNSDKARDFVKTHSVHAKDVMTRPATTVTPETPLVRIAQIMERRHIKRLPVVEDDVIVGLVSRADLLRALASHAPAAPAPLPRNDAAIRDAVLQAIAEEQEWTASTMVNVIVSDGTVNLWGVVDNDEQRKALIIAAENVPGVKAVEDHLARTLPT